MKKNISRALERARAYETETERNIRPEDRPVFHLCARVGWMNDPNGFSWHNGQYHLFYQYHPYDSHWGPMHWGHAVSSDLLHWTYLPCALAPDEPYDRDGCFSGCAVTLPDGRHALMYTGVSREDAASEYAAALQSQNIAVGDGINYRKIEENPVIDGTMLPPGGSPYEFRDPKILIMPDGSYLALVADNHNENGGMILTYRSTDLIRWGFVNVLAENRNRLGLMWECPDYFELDGTHVLLASAQDMLPEGFEYHNGNGTFYMTGDVDPATGVFTERGNHAVDYGIDFYAPQTILSPDGRRIMIGWLQNWDTCSMHVKSTPWFGMMSVPRELSLKDGILIQKPVREIEDLYISETVFENVAVTAEPVSLPGIEGRLADMEVEIRAANPEKMYQRLAIRFAQDDRYRTGVSIRPFESVLKIDRKFSGSRRAIIHQRRALVRHDHGALKLRLILDRFSVEVFVNDGEKVMSAAIPTDPSARGISFYCDGEARINVRFRKLKG